MKAYSFSTLKKTGCKYFGPISPAEIYLLRVINRNTRKLCKIRSYSQQGLKNGKVVSTNLGVTFFEGEAVDDMLLNRFTNWLAWNDISGVFPWICWIFVGQLSFETGTTTEYFYQVIKLDFRVFRLFSKSIRA